VRSSADRVAQFPYSGEVGSGRTGWKNNKVTDCDCRFDGLFVSWWNIDEHELIVSNERCLPINALGDGQLDLKRQGIISVFCAFRSFKR
jgi:hypothetical protein